MNKFIDISKVASEDRKRTLNELKSYIGNELSRNLEIGVYSALFEDDDVLLLFDGKEGSGKSKFMRLCAAYCHLLTLEFGFPSKFGVDNIHFDLDSYIDTSNKAEKDGLKGHINILDESRKVAGNGPITKEKRRFLNFLSECRGANHIHFVALPAYHDMDKNIVMWRCKFDVHTIKRYVIDPSSPVGLKLHRGEYKVYDDDPRNGYQNTLKYNYMRSDLKYQYPKIPAFKGNFANVEVLDIAEYNEKKRSAKEDKYGTTFAEEEQEIIDKRIKKLSDAAYQKGREDAINNITYDELSSRLKNEIKYSYMMKVYSKTSELGVTGRKISDAFGIHYNTHSSLSSKMRAGEWKPIDVK